MIEATPSLPVKPKHQRPFFSFPRLRTRVAGKIARQIHSNSTSLIDPKRAIAVPPFSRRPPMVFLRISVPFRPPAMPILPDPFPLLISWPNNSSTASLNHHPRPRAPEQVLACAGTEAGCWQHMLARSLIFRCTAHKSLYRIQPRRSPPLLPEQGWRPSFNFAPWLHPVADAGLLLPAITILGTAPPERARRIAESVTCA